MEKWTIQCSIFKVKIIITNNAVVSVQRSFRKLFDIIGIGAVLSQNTT